MMKQVARTAIGLACIALAGGGCREVTSPVHESNTTGSVPGVQSKITLGPGPARMPTTSLVRGLTAPLGHPWVTAAPGDPVVLHHRHVPVPVPGGVQIPDGPFIHTFIPGPESLGFMGVDVEPNVITDFKGFAAMAYLHGQARDRDGNLFDMSNDIRVYSGEYVGADGERHHGTFGFI